MKLIKDLSAANKVKGDISVEIEYEGKNLPPPSTELRSAGWNYHTEGSLRGENAEYVMLTPSNLEGVKDCLDKLKGIFKLYSTIIRPTYRAGTHVHINVQEFTAKQVVTFVCAYYILEELLIDWCDESRKGNHFCLRSKDADFVIEQLVKSVEKNDLSLLNTEQIRYSSLNLQSLFKHGSLEFRAFESTTNWEKLLIWCAVLERIGKNSRKYQNPAHLITSVSSEGSGMFLRNILGDYSSLFKKPGWEVKLKNGVRTAQDIAFARNWEDKNLNIFLSSKGVF